MSAFAKAQAAPPRHRRSRGNLRFIGSRIRLSRRSTSPGATRHSAAALPHLLGDDPPRSLPRRRADAAPAAFAHWLGG
jgi:hypothetical protein